MVVIVAVSFSVTVLQMVREVTREMEENLWREHLHQLLNQNIL